MFYLCAFFLGSLIPFIARRFGKFEASDPAKALILSFHRPHFLFSVPETSHSALLKKKHFELFLHAFLLGIANLICWAVISFCFPPIYHIGLTTFCTLSLLLADIDNRWFILPDVLTVPLILFGFSFNVLTDFISVDASLIGALYGYFMPSLCILLTYRFKKDCFGFGDIKMMTALGAWFGFINLTYIVFISVISFALRSFISGKKENAYGPDLTFASLCILFYHIFIIKGLSFF
ncbi:MAG: prepilin peptidase [Alphaproteobacteria bacterium]|nr:prepilin peptidase [Alphaproteobacteria bacterium]